MPGSCPGTEVLRLTRKTHQMIGLLSPTIRNSKMNDAAISTRSNRASALLHMMRKSAGAEASQKLAVESDHLLH